jgi:hypothetical protein
MPVGAIGCSNRPKAGNPIIGLLFAPCILAPIRASVEASPRIVQWHCVVDKLNTHQSASLARSDHSATWTSKANPAAWPGWTLRSSPVLPPDGEYVMALPFRNHAREFSCRCSRICKEC